MIGWVTKPLGELCEVLDSRRRPVTKKDRRSGPYPYYGATGIVDHVDEFIFDEPLVLVGEDGAKWGSGDETAFSVTGKCWVNNHAHVLRPLRATLLDDWLVYYLVHQDLSPFVAGLTVPKLNQGSLREIPVPLPSVAEQRRIVTLLDEAFEGIATAKAHAEQNLQSAMDVLTQHLLSVFAASSGNAVPVASLARCSLGKMLDKAKNRGELKPYLRNLNVRWFEFDLDDLLEMKFTEDETDKYTVGKGDLVICEGGYPGRCAVWDQDQPIYIQKALHRARFVEPAHARWVQYYLYAQDISGGLRPHFTGSGIQHFTGAALAKLMVPLPELHVLRKHVELFDQLRADCERLRTVYQRKLTALTELQQSLLHQAFTGQL
nr:restriction endonuclease subunit S [uncultured Aquabacterium sp.]